jgi:choline dehydrogenase-like flavoprotein
MLIDGRKIEAGTELTADLCIIGGGPAGITLALALANTQLDVLLVESGGFEFDDAAHELNYVAADNLPYVVTDMRLRMFGGCSNHWAGYCRPLEPETFERRAWVPHSGWPIKRPDLDPYYPRAAELCQIGQVEPDPAVWAKKTKTRFFDFDHKSEIRHAVFQIAPYTRFGEVYRAPIVDAPNLRLCLDTTVTRLQPRHDGQWLDSVSATTFAGNAFTIRAKAFVLACGGIENARMLLVSNDVEPAGLGNRNDLVGRFFMDHGHFHLGNLMTWEPFDPRFYGIEEPGEDGPGLSIHLRLSRAAQERAGVGDQAIQFRDHVLTAGEHSFRAVKQALLRGHMPDNLWHHLSNVAGDFGPVVESVGRRIWYGRSDPRTYANMAALRYVGEQVPNPDSRVTLTDQRDRLGLPVARLDWRYTELDYHTFRGVRDLLAQEFGRLDIGRVQPFDDDPPQWADGGWHHMGTTRMSDDPKEGVVDRHGRVHSVGNLYVAGSSIFPTGDHGAPTLTIVALALRLAEHLRAELFV